MLGVIGHGDGLVDEKHRNAVLDAVGATQPGVVEQLVVADRQQRSTVLGTHQDVQQFSVEHDATSAERHPGPTGTTEDDTTLIERGGCPADREAVLPTLLLLLGDHLRLDLLLVGDRRFEG